MLMKNESRNVQSENFQGQNLFSPEMLHPRKVRREDRLFQLATMIQIPVILFLT